jgi:MoaD family protein
LAGVSVKLKLFATLRKNYGVKELDVECDGTIFNLIENASKILGRSFFDDIYDKNQGKVRDNIIFMINGRNIKDLGEKIKLTDNDVVAIFPPIAGGRIFRGVKRDR